MNKYYIFINILQNYIVIVIHGLPDGRSGVLVYNKGWDSFSVLALLGSTYILHSTFYILLQSEYERWWVKWQEDKDVGGTISNFVDSLHCADNDLYPNVRMILFISAVRPSTIAQNPHSNERSISTHKRLKTYLRFTMTADRLNGLSLMNINQDIEIPAETIVDNFGRLGPHRLAFL